MICKKVLSIIFFVWLITLVPCEASFQKDKTGSVSFYVLDQENPKIVLTLAKYIYSGNSLYFDLEIWSNKGIVYNPDNNIGQNLKFTISDAIYEYKWSSVLDENSQYQPVAHRKEEDGWFVSAFRLRELKSITTALDGNAQKVMIQIPIVGYKGILGNNTTRKNGDSIENFIIKVELPESIIQEWKNVIKS